jgi:two-component system sensor histidine kinase PhoQ
MLRSIHSRLLFVASLVLAAFFGLSGIALEKAFRQSVEEAARERLQGQIYGLLGAADVDTEGRMRLPRTLPDPRLSEPDSGLYARVVGENGAYQWSSPSLVGRSADFVRPVLPGEEVFQWISTPGRGEFLVLNFGVLWEDNEGQELAYTFAVAVATAGMLAQVGEFRATLFFWLGGAALLLLLVQGGVLRWGLRPLRRVASDLRRIESGRASELEGQYPPELKGLTRNINSLIKHGRASQTRYRNTLGDLAHSLKTPLAVLQGAVESGETDTLHQTARDQIQRMNEIIGYQLQRAAAARSDVAHALPVGPVVEKIVATLQKVYRDKGVSCSRELNPDAVFFGDEGDLMEVLGNLLENAFKYAAGVVRVHVGGSGPDQNEAHFVEITIEDDGPGILESAREQVLHRGERGDQQLPGQGIGLSVADEIIRIYGGELTIGESELGGAKLSIHLRRE